KSAPSSPFDLRFFVIESDDINAFAIAGGSIYVHTGLILKAANEAELAGVLAHEIGHVTERHIARNAAAADRPSFFARLIFTILGLATGNPYAREGGAVFTNLALTSYLNAFSRDYEREADKVAVEVLGKAGYDSEAMVSFFVTLKKEDV